MDKPILWVVETGSLSGGVRVILEYANRLTAMYGYKNIIYSLNERPKPKQQGGWFDLSPKVDWIRFGGYESLAKAAINLKPAMAIATWWKTAYCVKEIVEKTGCRGLYLVQDIETSYYISPIERGAVEATYGMGLEHFTTSKWVLSQMPDARYVGLAIGKWRGDDKVSRNRDVLACLRGQALKGFRELTETTRYLIASNIRLVTFGQGKAIQITSLHTHNPPDGNFLSDKQIEKLYSRVGVFISTSRHEGFCAHPDTLVWSNHILTPIVNVREADEVVSHTGQARRVISQTSREYDGEMVRITPKGLGASVTLTPEHPVIVGSRLQNEPIRFGDFRWERAGNVDPEHALVFPAARSRNQKFIFDMAGLEGVIVQDGIAINAARNGVSDKTYPHGMSKTIDRFVEFDADLCYLAGVYLGDGHATNKGQVLLCLSTFKEEVAERSIGIITSRFGCHPVREERDRNRVTYRFSHRLVARMFRGLFGFHASSKIVPRFVFDLPEEHRIEFLRGLWGTDGTFCKDGPRARASYSTTSFNLAWQIANLVIQCGIPATVQSAKSRVEYSVQLGTENTVKLARLLGYEVDNGELLKRNTICYFDSDNQWMVMPIRSIERVHYSGKVYNLEVEEDQSYATQSFAIHNCMPPLEAMACACPVIMFDAQGNMEYAKDGENCLIATSPRDMADKIVEVLSDRDLSRRLSISGQLTAKNYISWDPVIERLKLVVDNPPQPIVQSES